MEMEGGIAVELGVDRLPVSVAATAFGGVETRELQAQKPKEKSRQTTAAWTWQTIVDPPEKIRLR
jgi:hypothetical protein